MIPFTYDNEIVNHLKNKLNIELIGYEVFVDNASSYTWFSHRTKLTVNYKFNNKKKRITQTFWQSNFAHQDLAVCWILASHNLELNVEVKRGKYKGSKGIYKQHSWNPGVYLGKTIAGSEKHIPRSLRNVKLIDKQEFLIKCKGTEDETIDNIEILDLFGNRIETNDMIAFPEKNTLDVGRITDYDPITKQILVLSSKNVTRLFDTKYKFINLSKFNNDEAIDFLTIALLSC